MLVDAKRGDTPQTMRAYARAIFDELGADAVTLNPYLGGDSLAPFFDYADRGVFVLCKTSNPGAGEFQDLLVDGAEPLLRARRPARGDAGTGTARSGWWSARPTRRTSPRCATVAPDAPILLPGVGAQAGDLERSVQAAVDGDGGGRASSTPAAACCTPAVAPTGKQRPAREAQRMRVGDQRRARLRAQPRAR